MATKKASNGNKPPTKSEVFNQIASDTGLTRKEVGAVFESLGGMINKSLSSRGPGLFNVVGLMKIKVVKKPRKHMIHKAVKWKKMLHDGSVNSRSEIARKEDLTRARVTQIMNLLKLPAEMQVFLLGLEDARSVRKYSERKLRGHHE